MPSPRPIGTPARLLALLVLVLALVAGCGGGDGGDGPPGRADGSTTGSTGSTDDTGAAEDPSIGDGTAEDPAPEDASTDGGSEDGDTGDGDTGEGDTGDGDTGDGETGDGGDGETGDGSEDTATGEDGAAADGGADSVEQDIDSALQVTDAYWSTHWPELFTGSYSAPRVLGAYDGAAADVPTCGGSPLPDDNAVYCSDGDYVAWDMDLMRDGHGKGDAWVYLVIAHEWGHAVQNRLNAGLVSVARELQADCLAGAVLFGAARDGTLRFEEGDTDELSDALTELADATPWTDTSDHGDAGQRISFFNKGAESGVRGCLPNS
ncbi:neutral zinc metallopeptidase [Streptomyces sp. LX-29]|uniref:neutral zinc metallopeptidase n=1 Tax=Streptomyces sp. LX-29 TaxID=2900152 RepID=UPI00240E010E|nr:neutral zinc metallopeptidase [Streptomyces sp. LX-29]WFB06852.1 neutral zinc metallopeptidase [Streptomyces sp. LX-29]